MVRPLISVTGKVNFAGTGRDRYPLARTDQRSGSLNRYPRMDMPAPRIPAEDNHLKLVNPALFNEEGPRRGLSVDGPVLQAEQTPDPEPPA